MQLMLSWSNVYVLMFITGALLLGAVLYAWQFPHFNALSWNLRADYSRGGYRMCSVINPDMCKRVAFRYCIVMTGLCLAAPVIDLTTLTFAVDSLLPNLYLTYLGYRFYKDGDSKSSRKLFRFTLIHIPIIMLLMLISKKHYGAPPLGGTTQKKITHDDKTSEVKTQAAA